MRQALNLMNCGLTEWRVYQTLYKKKTHLWEMYNSRYVDLPPNHKKYNVSIFRTKYDLYS